LTLIGAVLGRVPFSALVLQGNERACRFYEKTGGRLAAERPEILVKTPVIDLLYVWDRELG